MNQRVVVLTDDDPGAELEKVQTALAGWISAGAQPWDLPPAAVHFALDCYGCESVSVGTSAALLAVSDECEECCGEGEFRDESHPAAGSTDCDHCKGHGRVPKPLERPGGITDDMVGNAINELSGHDAGSESSWIEVRRALEAALFP